MLLASAGVVVVVASILAVPQVVQIGHAVTPNRSLVPNRSLTRSAAARKDAAAWIARWVGRGSIVACDPLMCAELLRHGLLSANLWQITAGNADPLGSDVIAATAAIRSDFGARLASVYAPDVLARFGAGSSRIEVRVVAPEGAAAYGRALRADLLARRSAGGALLSNPSVSASASAARQLAAGAVDTRLLATLAALAVAVPVEVVGFGGAGPGASQGMPFLSVRITIARQPSAGGKVGPRAAKAAMARSLATIMAFLRAQRAPWRAARISERRPAHGPVIVQVDFAAPSPLLAFGAVTSVAVPGTGRH